MNIDLMLALAFYLFLICIYYKYKDRFEVQNKVFVLYKTKLGLRLMDKLARRVPRFLKFLGHISIFTGFAGMVAISVILVKVTKDLITVPGAVPGLAPVLPGVAIPGMPTLSFFHWILAILAVATVHEFLHGVYARLINVDVKSSGFAFLGPILAAFVEPDEKQLEKKTKKEQLLVYSAGPFANMLLAIVLIFLFGLSIPAIGLTHDITKYTAIVDVEDIANKTAEPVFKQLIIDKIERGSPAEAAGLKKGDKIIALDENLITNDTKEFFETLQNLKPGQKLNIKTLEKEIKLLVSEKAENASKGYIGISFKTDLSIEPKKELIEKYGRFIASIPLWLIMLVNWLIVINIGVGLFNLLPLGPVDGGKMFYVAMLALFKDDQGKARKAFITVTIFFVTLLLINLLPWIEKLLIFLFKPILAMIL